MPERRVPKPLEHVGPLPEQCAVIRAVTSLMYLQQCGVIEESEYMDIRRRIYLWDIGPEGAKASERAKENMAKRWERIPPLPESAL